jgi:hypothetical protein
MTTRPRSLEGSCLCGAVRFTVTGTPARFYHCHCSRCRKATGTGHATNLFVEGTLEWKSGHELVKLFKVPEAERFTNAFCSECGSRLPRERPGMVFVPAGSLDEDPDFLPQARIFVGSRTSWSCTAADLPEFSEYAT